MQEVVSRKKQDRKDFWEETKRGERERDWKKT